MPFVDLWQSLLIFGAHCNGGVKKALDRAVEIGADAVQLFAQSPRTWRFPEHAEEDLAHFRERREERRRRQRARARPLPLQPRDARTTTIYEKSVATMRSTMDTACAIEADGVVFHVGSHLGSGFEAGLERAVPALAQVLERCSDTTWLLLENSAGAGGTIGRSLDELAALVDALDGHPRLGVCLDSCHLYVSGVDVGDPDAVARSLDEVDARDRARPAARAARERRRRAARLEPRPARERAARASSASGSAPSSRTRRCRSCRP